MQIVNLATVFFFLVLVSLSIEQNATEQSVEDPNETPIVDTLYDLLQILSKGRKPGDISPRRFFQNMLAGFSNLISSEQNNTEEENSTESMNTPNSMTRPQTPPTSIDNSNFLPPYWRLCILGTCKIFPTPTRPPRSQCFPARCGENIYIANLSNGNSQPQNSFKKIVGGSRARPFSHPWTALLSKREGLLLHHCGAVVICSHWILTAAHCFDRQSRRRSTPDLDPADYSLYVGRHVGWNRKIGRQVQVFEGRRDIHSLHQHERYSPGFTRGIIQDDIGLIRLRRPIQFNNFVQPICLPHSNPPINTIVWASGWGITNDMGPNNNVLKEIALIIHNSSICNRDVVGFRDMNTSGIICAGGERNQDTCTGDSGGPLVGVDYQSIREGRRRYLLYGLTSVGSPSCNTNEETRQPSLYSNIRFYLPWIRRTTNNCCS